MISTSFSLVGTQEAYSAQRIIYKRDFTVRFFSVMQFQKVQIKLLFFKWAIHGVFLFSSFQYSCR